MLRAPALLVGSWLLTVGCLWEPIQLAPDAGNADAAPVIQSANPSSNQLFLSTRVPCLAQVGLPLVFSPRGVRLFASFYLNYPPAVAPLSIGGQTEFDLLVGSDDRVYTLANQQIHIDDYAGQFNGLTNTLTVFVSDDLRQCPFPTSAIQPILQPSGESHSLNCYTTSWTWVIEPFGCPVLQGL